MAETVKKTSISSNNQVAPDAHRYLVPSSATTIDEGDSSAIGEGDNTPRSRVYKRRVSRPFGSRQISEAILRNRTLSVFDFCHSDLILTAVPDIVRLQSIDISKVPWLTSQRFLLSILCFFGFVTMFAQRVNLSIAIVSMVDHDFLDSLARNQSGLVTPVVDQCPAMETRDNLHGDFHWDKKTQGMILGAFFWGYIVLQVFGGQVSERFGATRVITGGMLPVAILSLLSPVCARAHPYLFVAARALIGVGQSVMYPACQALWARWAPPYERSRLIGFSYAGGQFGNAIIFPITGYLCAYGFDGGWASSFYVPGAVGFLWCVLWMIFAADTPEQNRFISNIEKQYIQFAIGSRSTSKRRSTPWKAIFTSSGMWAIIVAHMCSNYGADMLLTQIPTYMKEVLRFDIKANGIYTMVPYLTFWLCITLACILADFLISKNILSVGATRKVMTALGTIGPGCFMIWTGFMDCTQRTEAVLLMIVAVGLCGFRFSGYFINHSDIALAYAGTMFGISNTAATIPGIVSPFIVAYQTPNGTREEWLNAFSVVAGLNFFGAIFFAVFAQGSIQTWAIQDADILSFTISEVEEGEEEETYNTLKLGACAVEPPFQDLNNLRNSGLKT